MLNSILLNNPEQYARVAIAIIEEQLKTANSPSRIAKLNRRLKQWQKALEILSTHNEEEISVSKK